MSGDSVRDRIRRHRRVVGGAVIVALIVLLWPCSERSPEPRPVEPPPPVSAP